MPDPTPRELAEELHRLAEELAPGYGPQVMVTPWCLLSEREQDLATRVAEGALVGILKPMLENVARAEAAALECDALLVKAQADGLVIDRIRAASEGLIIYPEEEPEPEPPLLRMPRPWWRWRS